MDVGLGSNFGVEVGLGSGVQLAVSNGSIIGTSVHTSIGGNNTSGQRLGSVSGVSDGGSSSIAGGSVGRGGSRITVASVGGGGVASRCDNAGSSHGNKSKGGNKRLHCER